MIRRFIISILAITWFCSCGQRSNSKTEKINIKSEKAVLAKVDNGQQSQIQNLEKYIYTDTTYVSSTGKGITIQNSLPKGGDIEPGIPYIDTTGKKYFVVVFWTRVINETDKALEFNINFPANSLPIPSTFNSYIKLLLPTDSMTFDKLASYSYGLTGIKSFLDTNFDKTSALERTLNPNEEHIFYTVALAYQAGGPARAAIILKEQELYYTIGMGPYSPLEIPSGKITFKNE